MSPEDPRHGTVAGYVAHVKAGGPKCHPCQLAARLYERNRHARRYLSRGPLVIDGTGTRRRLTALVAIGLTMQELDTALGRKRGYVSRLVTGRGDVLRKTAMAVAAMYEVRCMTPRIGWLADRQRRIAASNGWAPPLAYEDIDDPNEQPTGVAHRPVSNRPYAELVAEWDHLMSLRISEHHAAQQLGVSIAAVEKARERMGRAA